MGTGTHVWGFNTVAPESHRNKPWIVDDVIFAIFRPICRFLGRTYNLFVGDF